MKFEFEATINEALINDFEQIEIENVDILDEDDDGVQVWGIVHNENDLESFKAFFVPHKDMIQNCFVEHCFASLFESMETSPSDDEQFAVVINNNSDLQQFLKLIENN